MTGPYSIEVLLAHHRGRRATERVEGTMKAMTRQENDIHETYISGRGKRSQQLSEQNTLKSPTSIFPCDPPSVPRTLTSLDSSEMKKGDTP